MILTFLILLVIGIVLNIVYRHFKPFIEFSKKNKHLSGFSFMALKAGYEGIFSIDNNENFIF
jgi:hypothetical protein